MRYKNLDQLVTVGIVMVSVVLRLLPYHTPIVVILALLLVFVLPGYTLTQALTYKRPFEPSRTLVFSLGLSIAIDVLSGFILNLLPIGLHATSWVVFLGSLTSVLSLLTVYLRRGVQEVSAQWLIVRFTIRECILFGLAIIIVILSILYSAGGVIQQPHPGFTQLWLLPSDRSDARCAVRLGIRSFEAAPVRYAVVMTINGAKVNIKPFILLTPGQQWEQLVLIAFKADHNVYIEARLYRVDEPKIVYRTVHLTLSVHDLVACRTTIRQSRYG